MRGLAQVHAADGERGGALAIVVGHAGKAQIIVDELKAGHAARERIELGGVAADAEQLFRIGWRNAQNPDRAACRTNQAR